ncbi:MAG: class I SAM-dependent rRNA methyltransferase [Planctomycetota bacterium]
MSESIDPAAVSVQLTARASGFARRGRPWFFRDDLQRAEVPPGRLVRCVDEHGRDLGLGVTSSSKLALRRCGPWPGDAVPGREEFFRARLDAAIAARAGLLGPEQGARLVHGEADWLPGLVVDRYADVLVLQVTSAFVEASLDAVVPYLAERLGAASVVARNDVPTRKREGLVEGVELLHGARRTEAVVVEGDVRHTARPLTGHKTGFYLDQRPARALVQAMAKGKRVLDLFSYQGGFSLHALRGGARAALAVDQSEDALAQARSDAERNGLDGLETRCGDVFDVARALRERGETFDLVVLDPPAFAKSKRELAGAERGYRDLNRQALRLLAPHGQLVTCTCSHHVTPPRFEELVRQAAAGLPFRIALRQRLGAGDDHPALVTHPESEYLKVLRVQRMEDA